jgi:hypothetical protein
LNINFDQETLWRRFSFGGNAKKVKKAKKKEGDMKSKNFQFQNLFFSKSRNIGKSRLVFFSGDDLLTCSVPKYNVFQKEDFKSSKSPSTSCVNTKRFSKKTFLVAWAGGANPGSFLFCLF